ncbi:MAG: SGNH/GDSL hydrolase family protein [Deltaproteobacteria bacterium]|nr:SGNH/GDSL hydrolase family protein [Deltaproteobacteria bacterium]
MLDLHKSRLSISIHIMTPKGRFTLKESVLVVTSFILAAAAALGLLRWLAPQLLGIPVDLQLVQTDERLPPYYEGVFRESDWRNFSFTLKDPRTKTRMHPLFPDMGLAGPNDLIGFRNRSVPDRADVVVIGDSQTYGLNATFEDSWPQQLRQALPDHTVLYSMASSGWGPLQYLDMTPKALRLQPRVLVVAYYTGNDALDAFMLAYGTDLNPDLRVDPALTAADAPKVKYPPPGDELWHVRLPNGIKVVLAPEYRLSCNRRQPAIDAGYEIMARTAERIAALARAKNVLPVFTVIPTKELVYAKRVKETGLDAPRQYLELVQAETGHIDMLLQRLHAIRDAVVVDLLPFLRAAADHDVRLYGTDSDSHPQRGGYRVIGTALAPVVSARIPPPLTDGVYLRPIKGQVPHWVLLRNGRFRPFKSPGVVKACGWSLSSPPRTLTPRDLVTFPFGPAITKADEMHCGPLVR